MTREEIIKGVKVCVGMYYGFRCGECPYGPYRSDCVESLHMDVERLVEVQTPRGFNVGDFYGEEFGYLEYRPKIPGFSDFEPTPILISDIDEENVTVIFKSASVLKLPLDKMGKSWRIWSDYPTHELLKAVKWDV